MCKIRLLTARTGPGGFADDGDVIEVSRDEARRMVDSQQAVYVEVMTKAAPENAAQRTMKLKGQRQ